MKPESVIQRAVRHYLRLQGVESVSVPNGAVLAGAADQRARQMNALKADGLMAGFPDLLLYPRHIAAIGHVEIKVEGGRLSDNQKACHDWLLSIGHRVAVVRSIDDMAETLEAWGWVQ